MGYQYRCRCLIHIYENPLLGDFFIVFFPIFLILEAYSSYHMAYNHTSIEQKWQKFWNENKTFKTEN